MHRAILSQIQRTAGPVQLMRIYSERGCAIICAFNEGEASPLWVAKIARNAEAIARLKREHQALSYLAPWAELLQLPRILVWEECSEDACLIMSGVAGQQMVLTLSRNASIKTVKHSFGPVVSWLHTFWLKVPPPPPATSVNRLADSLCRRIAAMEEWRDRMDGVIEVLARGRPCGDAPPVPVHGDFFSMNVMLSRGELHVIDWDHFTAGFPLHDLFGFIVNSQYIHARRLCAKTEAYFHVLFSQSPVSRFLRDQIRQLQVSPEIARFYFYGFLATQVLVETATPPTEWYPLLEELKRLDYPGPDPLY